MSSNPSDNVRPSSKLPLEVWLALAAVAGLCWIWWPTFADMASRWGEESQYSHGFLVPPFALLLLWFRRDMLPSVTPKPAAIWGLGFLGMGLALRFLATFIFFDWLSAVSLLPCLAGVCLLAGGWKTLGWAWPALAFLIFMVPLPHRVEVGLAHPLQRVATLSSTFVLQTLGFSAFNEGNVIRIGEDVRIGVVEACSGLSMLLIFFALSTAVVLLSPRTPLEKGLIFLSTVPIALIANITRIVAAALFHVFVGPDFANYFHSSFLAAWLMMFLALGLLWLEMRLLSWVLVEKASKSGLAYGVPGMRKKKTKQSPGAPAAVSAEKQTKAPAPKR